MIDDKRLTEVNRESSDIFDREAMAKDRALASKVNQQRPSLEEKSGSGRRNSLGFKDRSPVERPAGEIPQPQYLLETTHAMGRPGRLAQYLESLLK